MNKLQGYRTIIVAALTALAGIAAKAGFELPPDFALTTSDTLIAVGAVFGALRFATKTPVGKKDA